MRPSTAQVNNLSPSQKWYSTADPVPSQLSSIASQPALGAGLLSQAFDSAPTEPPSADPQKEPISVEITDASITVENVSFIFDACQSIFFNFWSILASIPNLAFYHARHFLRKHPRKSRSLTVHLMILSASKVILLIPQLSMQLMVRKLDAPFNFPQ